ncbi:MAG: imelysin family protein [Pseudomonadota bacterium]
MPLHRLTLALFLAWTTGAAAADADIDPAHVVAAHVIPGFVALDDAAQALAETAAKRCNPEDTRLRGAYAVAFDAWIRVSHLRFGPTEAGNRGFALAFWPDSRGATPKALTALISAEDPVVFSKDDFATVSIAARGFYAMEYLLYDPTGATQGDGAYRCALIQAITQDIRATVADILADWRNGHADLFVTAGRNDVYRSREEALQQLFGALSTGLQFSSDTRLGRPMGTFERPRPARAEARRAGRSLRHVVLSLEATRDLAAHLSAGDATLDAAFARAITRADDLDDPIFAGVADPQGRLRVELLQQAIDRIRQIVASDLGPRLGVAGGFNALDGD